MTKLLLRLGINAAALWVALNFVPGLHYAPDKWWHIFVLALIFGVINAFVRPLIELLTCPLVVLTLGLGTILINMLMFWLAGEIGNAFGFGFTADNLWAIFFGGLITSLVSGILTLFLKDELSGKRKKSRPKPTP
jgi:putative membrane protein